MPEVVMSYVCQSTARSADISRHIDELRESMDLAARGLDGFSDSETDLEGPGDRGTGDNVPDGHVSGDRVAGDHVPGEERAAAKAKSSAHTDHKKHHCRKREHVKHGLAAKRHAGKLARSKSHEDKKAAHTAPHVKHGHAQEHGHARSHPNDDVGNSDEVECFDRHDEQTKRLLKCSDSVLYAAMRAGQDPAEEAVPIMTPPPEVTEPVPTDRRSSSSGCLFGRTMSLHFLTVGENIVCQFDPEKYFDSNKSLLTISEKPKALECICCSNNSTGGTTGFGGWEGEEPKFLKTKTCKRKKSVKPQSSDVAFDRLTGAGFVDKCKIPFQHYRNTSKYMESYRLLHTVENAGRPLTAAATPLYAQKPPSEADPYFSKMKTTIW